MQTLETCSYCMTGDGTRCGCSEPCRSGYCPLGQGTRWFMEIAK